MKKNLYFTYSGHNKMGIIKTVRQITQYDLSTAFHITIDSENVPQQIRPINISRKVGKETLEALGAKCEVR